MAYVINKNKGKRGTEPDYHARYKDSAGKWCSIKVPDEYTATKKTAEKWAEDEQAKIDDGAPDPKRAQTVEELGKLWLATLKNRDTKNDKSRWRRHVLPFF